MCSITFGDFKTNLSEADVLRLQNILYGIEPRSFRPLVPQIQPTINGLAVEIQKLNLINHNDEAPIDISSSEVSSTANANCDENKIEAKSVSVPVKPASWAALVASKQPAVKPVGNEQNRNGDARPTHSAQPRNGAASSNGPSASEHNVNGTQLADSTVPNTACNTDANSPAAEADNFIGSGRQQQAEVVFDPYLEQLQIDLVSAERAIQRELERLDALADRGLAGRNRDPHTYTLSERPLFRSSMMPCTLRNLGNTCYANSVLQSLFNSGVFINVLRNITVLPSLRDASGQLSEFSNRTPFVDALIELSRNFQQQLEDLGNMSNTKLKDVLRAVCIVEPRQLINSVEGRFGSGTQNDAEEFYTFLMNALHDEMVFVTNRTSADNDGLSASSTIVNQANVANEAEADADWLCVDGRRTVVLRDAVARAQRDSPVSCVFSGLQRTTYIHRDVSSSASQRDTSERSANVQPFFCLQLDVNAGSDADDSPARSVSAALSDLFNKENVEQGGCLRRTTLDRLPAVLVLHVKCFAYVQSAAEIVKLFGKLTIDNELQIPATSLTGSAKQHAKTTSSTTVKRGPSKHGAVYRIRSAIFHHGTKLQNGHYTCFAYHDALNNWLQYDDELVRGVRSDDVLSYWNTWPSKLHSGSHEPVASEKQIASADSLPIQTRNGPRMPYLLFYERVA